MEALKLYPHVKTEAAKGRTYGECVMDEIFSIQMIDGEFRTTLHIKEKPKRLSREDALIYYTQKLRSFWANSKK
ncbi:MAG: hypothetical protein PHW18_09560 [Sulfuricurvum sp.]|uniref:hypothetical protein n=1 Tax=Sulfuricurvum sp. TaxID=2025608 RepID=UPI00263A2A5B|nr:hypothetical protein [Sulfuricurvum sp.]MDD2829805.1 hypothetical protein [Sulfuricurvum sp.]MDD4950286.1 hypothetical protein [Sulfuricurvum sp.]